MSEMIIGMEDLPEGSIWTGDARTFIHEGCVKAWGYQVPYGRISITATYRTPTGDKVLIEKGVEKYITYEDACADLREAGY